MSRRPTSDRTAIKNKKAMSKKTKDGEKIICSLCGGGFEPTEEQVHHIIPFSMNSDNRSSEENLVNLCKKCHKLYHRILDLGDISFYEKALLALSKDAKETIDISNVRDRIAKFREKEKKEIEEAFKKLGHPIRK